MADIGALIERWQHGDERAAEAIYHHFRDSTFGLACTFLDDAADAEEVAQDALTYALAHIDRYDPQRARFSTWLHTITVSRRRFLPSLSLFTWLKGGGDTPDPTPGPELQAIEQTTRDEVWAAIQTLSQPMREAILLRHWSDYTYQEIGDMLGCSLRTAQSRVRLAHRQLRTILTEDSFADFEEKLG